MMIQSLHFLGSRIRHARLLRDQAWIWNRVQPRCANVLAQFYQRRGLLTWVNGDRFRLDATCGERYGRFSPQTYERSLYTAFVKVLRPGMRVFDIGAFRGIFTLGAARRIGSGRVYAFEPCPESAAQLRRHVAFNGCENRVEIVEAAVRSVTLDAFCDAARVVPDVLKIDVEGAELQVLRGATELLRNSRPTIFCEVHPRQMANCGSTLEELHAFLHSIGYVNELITEPDNGGIFHARMTHVNGRTTCFDECSS